MAHSMIIADNDRWTKEAYKHDEYVAVNPSLEFD